MAKKLTNKKISSIVEELFKKHCTGVQFNIMELGQVTGPAEKVLKEGGSIEEAETCLIIDREALRLN